ncbi:MAG: hypothetical protein IPN23_10805 [Elusimicrobia bacterium]|nr:hypothetical protein [Elusimicrobiota bacterium]
MARIGAGLSRVPNLAANIFALPYNTIVTLTGNEDMAQRSPKMFEKEARWWDEKATQLSEGFEDGDQKAKILCPLRNGKTQARLLPTSLTKS